jgi:hypothetical protein
LVFALTLLVFPSAGAQEEGTLAASEVPAVEPATEGQEPVTNDVNQPVFPAHQVEIADAPAIRVEPPPPQVIQVQLPTVPVMAREDIELLVNRLVSVEERMAGQQENAMDMVVRSNQTILVVAAVLGGLSLLGIVGASVILMRAFNRISDVMLTLPMGQQLGRGMSLASLAIDDLQPAPPSALEQVSARFLGALEQLEKRIRELEAGPGLPRSGTRAEGNGHNNADTPDNPPDGAADAGTESKASLDSAAQTKPEPESVNDTRHRIHRLLEEGETLVQGDKYEEALIRFDQALAIEPRNSDALIKRGMTLERLQRMDAALESYDRAIATNGSLTLAYLHKGAICNRLQRYREALECYERALQAEQKT